MPAIASPRHTNNPSRLHRRQAGSYNDRVHRNAFIKELPHGLDATAA
ncbi:MULTISPECIES: hypothetical protein [Pseudomonas]|nr:hypothetical protein [Pseudomonas azotoformans]UMY50655.1 hypothetical protein MLC69_06270 [Pseudomonas azotoformans]